jgi:VanZ family protein
VTQKTSAWPLALSYTALIVYASLYPFSDWRDQGIVPWFYLTAPLPKYWTWFDLVCNVLGYAPLGFLYALSSLRSGGPRRSAHAVLLASTACGLLSFAMETLQSYLPVRVPSNVDLTLNLLGGWLGAVTAFSLEKLGAIDHWSRIRAHWFVDDARGALVLLALWPVALLFPTPVPLGLGQVMERLEAALGDALQGTPFLAWLPVREVELQPLLPSEGLLCAMLGVLIPCLLGYCIMHSKTRRALFLIATIAVGICATALSDALSYGPSHAWGWFSLPVQVGLGVAFPVGLALLAMPRRACAALLLVALAVQLGVLNQAPASAYFSQTLQTWEQGRFIRFHGVIQWMGWLWPYVTLVYVLVRVSRREPGT